MFDRNQIRIALTLACIASMVPSLTAYAADEHCFPETGMCISGAIRTYWEANGGLAVFGYPITAQTIEDNGEGFRGPTQWFERDRLEDHGSLGVLAGRLGAVQLAREDRPWETIPKTTGAPDGCRFFSETGHTLCPPFRDYWENNGGLARFGYPISEPGVEAVASGWAGTVQWFERRRMEVHPENNPPYNLLLGLLGHEIHTANVPAPPSASNDLINRVVARTNAYRVQNGCAALTPNAQLATAAQAHSDDMAQNDFFSHTGSDGATFDQRIRRAGYSFSRAAENIAAGYDSPESVVDDWFNETPPNDGHRRNILNCALRDVGIGYTFLPNDTGKVVYKSYWTQDFGTR